MAGRLTAGVVVGGSGGANEKPRSSPAAREALGPAGCFVQGAPQHAARFRAQGEIVAQVLHVQRALRARGLPSTVRQRRGIDVAAGCGQLRAEKARAVAA